MRPAAWRVWWQRRTTFWRYFGRFFYRTIFKLKWLETVNQIGNKSELILQQTSCHFSTKVEVRSINNGVHPSSSSSIAHHHKKQVFVRRTDAGLGCARTKWGGEFRNTSPQIIRETRREKEVDSFKYGSSNKGVASLQVISRAISTAFNSPKDCLKLGFGEASQQEYPSSLLIEIRGKWCICVFIGWNHVYCWCCTVASGFGGHNWSMSGKIICSDQRFHISLFMLQSPSIFKHKEES